MPRSRYLDRPTVGADAAAAAVAAVYANRVDVGGGVSGGLNHERDGLYFAQGISETSGWPSPSSGWIKDTTSGHPLVVPDIRNVFMVGTVDIDLRTFVIDPSFSTLYLAIDTAFLNPSDVPWLGGFAQAQVYLTSDIGSKHFGFAFCNRLTPDTYTFAIKITTVSGFGGSAGAIDFVTRYTIVSAD